MVRRRLDPQADTLPSPFTDSGTSASSPLTEGSPTASHAAGDQVPLAPEGASRPGCLGIDEVLAFQVGGTSEEDRERIHAHLDECEHCRLLVEHVIRDSAPLSTGLQPGVMTFARGNLLAGRYLIKRFVAHGGMGEVYEAYDNLGRKKVALKTVLCATSDSPRAIHKLVEEVRNAQRVTHPNVCRINELHQHQSADADLPLHFLTMEFVDGERLSSRLRQGPLPLPSAIQIARQLLDGLRAAHRQGVLHLDFKSDNVMLRGDSSSSDAVIMDFGLSRALDSQSRMRTSERRQLAGSVHYMSPEQVQCDPNLGPQTDVYAFGVVLFEMLTGSLPFDGDSPYTIMLQRLKKRPRAPSELVPGLPPALDAFVLECLNRDPRLRFRDAAAALESFDRLGAGDGKESPAVRRRPWLLIAAAALVLGLAIYLWNQPAGPSREERALRAAPSAAQNTPVASPPLAAPERAAAAGSASAPALAGAAIVEARPIAPVAAEASAPPALPPAATTAPVRAASKAKSGASGRTDPPPQSRSGEPPALPSPPPVVDAAPARSVKGAKQPTLPGAPPGLF
jgi:hypothetical protein